MPGVNSFSPSPLSFLCAGRRILIIAWTPTFFWLKARKTSLGSRRRRLDAVILLVLAGLAGAAGP